MRHGKYPPRPSNIAVTIRQRSWGEELINGTIIIITIITILCFFMMLKEYPVQW